MNLLCSYKLMYSFSIIKQMVLERFENRHRIYFDLLSPPHMFCADLDEGQQKTVFKNNCSKHNLQWQRTVTFQIAPTTTRHDEGNSASQSNYDQYSKEECLLGMSKS